MTNIDNVIKGKLYHSQSKEINIVFSQSQSQNDSSSSKNNNISSIMIDTQFYKENISLLQIQIDSLTKLLALKNKILLSSNNNTPSTPNPQNENDKYSMRIQYEKKILEIKSKYEQEEKKLKEELKLIKTIKKEIDDFPMRKYQLKKKKERLISLKNQTPREKNEICFTKINNEEINSHYEQVMTTSGNEMCRSRLGNKMLMSLDIDEINRNQNFMKNKLAYPTIQRKKITFNFEGNNKENKKINNHPLTNSRSTFINNNNMNINKGNIAVNSNTKSMGKKKITLDNYNNFNGGDNFGFVAKTMY